MKSFIFRSIELAFASDMVKTPTISNLSDKDDRLESGNYHSIYLGEGGEQQQPQELVESSMRVKIYHIGRYLG
jgi:hypothetical protein